MSDQLNLTDLNLLDQQLDDIEDLPGFETPVNGEYILELSAQAKKIKNIASLTLDYTVNSCVKQDDESEKPTAVGTKFSQLFMLEGDPEKVKMAIGSVKPLLAPIGEAIGEGNAMKIVQHIQERGSILIAATVKRRQDKEDKEKFYPVVKNIRLA